jgi:hypothetical protein
MVIVTGNVAVIMTPILIEPAKALARVLAGKSSE